MTEGTPRPGSLLGKTDIEAALRAPLTERLFIEPLLDAARQIGTSSVDLRLGHEFVTAKRPNVASISPLEDRGYLKAQQPLLVPRGEKLVLHPNDLILGATLEYVRLPPGLAAYVTSRSSWGRAGLVIATAIAIHPGYAGIITLELTNVGTVPLELYPGVRIAQIVFHRCTGNDVYKGSFACPTTPSVGIVSEDDIAFWKQVQRIPRQPKV